MKVMGFVNRFSRGVQRVQEELKANGNAEADFNLELETAFLVKVSISQKSIIPKDETMDETKDETMDETMEISDVAKIVYRAIFSSPNDTRVQLIARLKLSESTINRAVSELKRKGLIVREGGKRFGFWKILRNIGND